MAEQFLSEIRVFSFNFPPKGWAFCNGQLLSINQNQALFSLLGTTYGGDGQTTFALPNLQGRVPMHNGVGSGGLSLILGQIGGEQSQTLLISELPSHTHTLNAAPAPAAGGVATPGGNVPLQTASAAFYDGSPNTSMTPSVVQNAGSNQPHENMCPYLVLNYCISLAGIFPSRN